MQINKVVTSKEEHAVPEAEMKVFQGENGHLCESLLKTQ